LAVGSVSPTELFLQHNQEKDFAGSEHDPQEMPAPQSNGGRSRGSLSGCGCSHTTENRTKLDFSASHRLGVESLCRISDGLATAGMHGPG
jgi:hypothetical protein